MKYLSVPGGLQHESKVLDSAYRIFESQTKSVKFMLHSYITLLLSIAYFPVFFLVLFLLYLSQYLSQSLEIPDFDFS